MVGGKPVTLPAEPLNGDKPVRQGYLTVLEAVPFTLDAMTLEVGAEQNQAGTIEVFAERRDGFTGDIKLVTEGFDAARDPLSKNFDGGEGMIKANESVGKITLTPKLSSEVGIRTVVVRGEATADGRQVVTYTQPMPVAVTQYPLILSSTLPRLSLTVLPPGTESSAGEAETKIRVERRAGFGGDVELSLEGLPEGVKSEVPKIPAGVSEISLKLFATGKAKLGTNFNLKVVGTAVFNDRNYKTRTGNIGLTIALPEAVEVVATNAVPAKVEGTK